MNSSFYAQEAWLALVLPLAPEAFVTGSRAFGTAAEWEDSTDLKKTSDTDIAVLVANSDKVRTALATKFPASVEDSSYNNGFKFSTSHGTLNIVPLHPLDFVCWKLTTKHIRDIVAICPDAKERIRMRETKLGIFEALTGIHKMLVPSKGSDAMEELAERIQS